MPRPLPHRIRRLQWEVHVPATSDAVALRTLLREKVDAVEAAFEEVLSSDDDDTVVRRITKLELDIRVPSIEALESGLSSRLTAALRRALDAAAPADEVSTSAHLHAQWIHYVETGSLQWSLAGLTSDETRAALESAAVAAAESWLSNAIAFPFARGGAFAARVAAFTRWLALLPGALQERLVEHARRSQSSDLTAQWDAVLAEITSRPLESRAVRLALISEAADAPAVLRRWIDERCSPLDGHTRAALDRIRAAPSSTSVASSIQETAPNPAEASERVGRFVPCAGLVLLHPYLPPLLAALKLWERGTRGALPVTSSSRAISLLWWLATGGDDPLEHELPVVKLLLGMSPDEPLDRRRPPSTAEEREECAALLSAVIAHWPVLQNTGIEALRASFLQRRGLLSRRDGAWYLHLESKPFDMLLARLPWSLSPILFSWSDAPLYVEWRTP